MHVRCTSTVFVEGTKTFSFRSSAAVSSFNLPSGISGPNVPHILVFSEVPPQLAASVHSTHSSVIHDSVFCGTLFFPQEATTQARQKYLQRVRVGVSG
jgi:hypothetical protein